MRMCGENGFCFSPQVFVVYASVPECYNVNTGGGRSAARNLCLKEL